MTGDLVEKTTVLACRPEIAVNACRGLGAGHALLVAMALFDLFLQKRRSSEAEKRDR